MQEDQGYTYTFLASHQSVITSGSFLYLIAVEYSSSSDMSKAWMTVRLQG